jgi:hypothetical protein
VSVGVWGPFPPEWGPAPVIRFGSAAESADIRRVSMWISACEMADRARGVVQGTDALAAIQARAARPTGRMTSAQALAELESRRIPLTGEQATARLRRAPLNRTLHGSEAAAMLEALRDGSPPPPQTGERMYRYARGIAAN